ncbi:MAG: hypothetical protein N3F63_06160 [Thermoplasmata archaeon]|nr:hypothetical protein [Thermoplasmata archaeon]
MEIGLGVVLASTLLLPVLVVSILVLFMLLFIFMLLLVADIMEGGVERQEEVRPMYSYPTYQYYMWMPEPPEPRILKVFAREGNKVWNLFFAGRNAKGELCLHYLGPKPVSRINAGKDELLDAMKENRNFVKLLPYSRRAKLPCIVLPKRQITKQMEIVLQPGIFKDALIVDLEKYRGDLHFIPFLLEPDRAYIVDELKKELPKKNDVLIFTDVKPWVVIAVFEV